MQPTLEEKINVEDLVLSSNATPMQDVRYESISIEIKQVSVDNET